jgi:hypothetical protein
MTEGEKGRKRRSDEIIFNLHLLHIAVHPLHFTCHKISPLLPFSPSPLLPYFPSPLLPFSLSTLRASASS